MIYDYFPTHLYDKKFFQFFEISRLLRIQKWQGKKENRQFNKYATIDTRVFTGSYYIRVIFMNLFLLYPNKSYLRFRDMLRIL